MSIHQPALASGPMRRVVRPSHAVMAIIAILAIIVLVSLFASYLAPFDPAAIKPRFRLRPPGEIYWFGSDTLGRDVFSRVLYGGQLSLIVGSLAAITSTISGALIGLVAGSSRLTDMVIMRVMDGIMAIPGVLLAVAIVSLFGASLTSIVIAIAIAEIPRVTRLVRGVVLSTREEAFVHAAQGLGIPMWKIALRHILPNCFGPLVVQATAMFASAVLAEAALGFLGVGFPPDIPTWGNILAEGRVVFERAPWIVLFPGLFIAITVLAVNVLGDELRDRLDPRFSSNAKAES